MSPIDDNPPKEKKDSKATITFEQVELNAKTSYL